MANTKITALTALGAVPASNDQFVVVDVSDTTHAASGTTKKLDASYIAFKAQANQFSGVVSTASGDNGTEAAAGFTSGRNSNGSTPSPGWFRAVEADGGDDAIYPDNSGIWRTLSGEAPKNATFASGTVVGSQSSHIAYKDVLGDPVSDDEALALICEAANIVRRFTYKDGRYGGEEFSGLVLDGETLHRYGMDADPSHAAGKALNLITVIGDLILAVRALATKVAELEG